jgi:hypothetical protein
MCFVSSGGEKPADTAAFDTVIIAEIHQTKYVDVTDVGGVFQL